MLQVRLTKGAFGLPDRGLPARITDAGFAHFRGVATDDGPDLANEVIPPAALDWAPFLERGWFNVEHGEGNLPGYMGSAGYPLSVEPPRLGAAGFVETPVTGVLLLGTGGGSAAYQLAKALQELERSTGRPAPRRLGLSVEGVTHARDPRNPQRIVKATITHVAITAKPYNPRTRIEVEELRKSRPHVRGLVTDALLTDRAFSGILDRDDPRRAPLLAAARLGFTAPELGALREVLG
jgi:hypothetical protein